MHQLAHRVPEQRDQQLLGPRPVQLLGSQLVLSPGVEVQCGLALAVRSFAL